MIDSALIDALRGLAVTRSLGADDVMPMTAKGVNHDHYRLARVEMVLRVPRATPWAGDAAAPVMGSRLHPQGTADGSRQTGLRDPTERKARPLVEPGGN